MSEQRWNPWKMTAIGMALVAATALVTGLVVANWVGNKEPAPTVAEPTQPVTQHARAVTGRTQPVTTASAGSVPPAASGRPAPATPSAADVEACNQYAKAAVGDKTTAALKDAVIGGALGAGVGAAGGAIAGGGRGAGKGAAIGGIVGVAAGTLYGINEANRHDARYVEAYRACMRGRGYTS